MREPQEMEEEPVIISDSETESKWDLESSSGSDWSENEETLRTQSCKEKEQTGTTEAMSENCREKLQEQQFDGSRTLNNPARNMPFLLDSCLSLEQHIKNNSQLPVMCGNKEGSLYVEKYNKGEMCILSEGQWFKPTDFEKFGGKAKYKKWKISILCLSFPLQKLIEDGLLSSPKFLSQSNKKLLPSSSEMISGHYENGGDHNDDEIDITMFQDPTLPVTCGSVSGILHKRRFAAGHCGKCIRTEDSWLTPEDFIRLGKQDGIWKKDIMSHEIPLGKLIVHSVLKLHAIHCECDDCHELDHSNDDMCYVCDCVGKLVCCDECPRAFHPDCHLPSVDSDSGDQWSCTFCVMKKTEVSNHQTRQDVLNSPLSQYTLQCQYLLLYLLHESNTFIPDICVSGNNNIKETHDMKFNLPNKAYQMVGEFVTDIERICQHCTTIGENDMSRMERLFKKEFETIFKLV